MMDWVGLNEATHYFTSRGYLENQEEEGQYLYDIDIT